MNAALECAVLIPVSPDGSVFCTSLSRDLTSQDKHGMDPQWRGSLSIHQSFYGLSDISSASSALKAAS